MTKAERTRSGILTRAQKRARCLQLRAGGLTEDEIAAQLTSEGHQTTQQGVSRIITYALEQMRNSDAANIELVRQMKLYELDQLRRAIWPDALRGKIDAVTEARQLITSQAKLAGAEAPAEQPSGVDPQVSITLLGISEKDVQQLEEIWRRSTDAGDVLEGSARPAAALPAPKS